MHPHQVVLIGKTEWAGLHQTSLRGSVARHVLKPIGHSCCPVVTPEQPHTTFTCQSAPASRGVLRSTRDCRPSNVHHRGSRWDRPQLARSDRAVRTRRVVRRTMGLRANGFMGAPTERPRLGPVGAHPAREEHYSNAGWLSSGKLSGPLYSSDRAQTVHNETAQHRPAHGVALTTGRRMGSVKWAHTGCAFGRS